MAPIAMTRNLVRMGFSFDWLVWSRPEPDGTDAGWLLYQSTASGRARVGTVRGWPYPTSRSRLQRSARHQSCRVQATGCVSELPGRRLPRGVPGVFLSGFRYQGVCMTDIVAEAAIG